MDDTDKKLEELHCIIHEMFNLKENSYYLHFLPQRNPLKVKIRANIDESNESNKHLVKKMLEETLVKYFL